MVINSLWRQSFREETRSVYVKMASVLCPLFADINIIRLGSGSLSGGTTGVVKSGVIL